MKKQKINQQRKTNQTKVQNNPFVDYSVGIKAGSLTAQPEINRHHLIKKNEKPF